jgi:hypothetical protein
LYRIYHPPKEVNVIISGVATIHVKVIGASFYLYQISERPPNSRQAVRRTEMQSVSRPFAVL